MAAGKKNTEGKTSHPVGIEGSLRDSAEEQLIRSPPVSSELNDQTAEKLIHELRVHQIELEMQAEELKRAHLALEESRNKYLDLYEFAPLGYLTFNDKARITGANLTAATLLGVERSNLIKAPLNKFLSEKDSDQCHLYFLNLLDQGGKQTCTLTLNRGDGSTFPARLEGVRIIDASDGTSTVRVAISDITDIRKAEVALKESERFLTTIVEHIPDMIFVKDARDLRFVRLNKAGEDLLGYSREEMLGKTDRDFFPEDEAIFITGNDREVLLTNQVCDNPQEKIHTRNKGERILHTKKIPIVDDKGVPRYLLGISEDITELKRVRDALQESERKFRNLYQYAPVGLFEISFNDRSVVTCNEKFATLMGFSSVEDAIGMDIFPVYENPEDGKEVIRTIHQEGHIEDHIIRLKNIQTGIPFWAQFSARYNREKDVAEGSIIDITERRAAEEVLNRFSEDLERKVAERTLEINDINMKLMTEIAIRLDAEKQLTKTVGEKEVLLKEVHHRVKNNLQIIISLLHLQSRYITDEATLFALKESQNRVKAMALVHEKLYQSEDLTKLDLENYIKFLGNNLFQFLGMKGKGITLTTNIKDIFLAIDTAIPLGLMINELISNSLKYAFPDGKKGEISLVITRQDHTLTILFKDNGVGIPADFDWRNATSLGLRLVCSLVEQLDGTIELDRSSGTAFTIIVKEKV